jgi:hypothetical protein
MADRMEKIWSLFAVLFGNGAENEKLKALDMLKNSLRGTGLDIYGLIERMKNPAPNPDEVQKIHDDGYWKGHAVGAQGRRSPMFTAATPPVGASTNADGSGINGYEWSQIVEHCYANRHVFRDPRDLEFVESIKEQFDTYRSRPSPAQAKWLRDLFMREFSGSI